MFIQIDGKVNQNGIIQGNWAKKEEKGEGDRGGGIVKVDDRVRRVIKTRSLIRSSK